MLGSDGSSEGSGSGGKGGCDVVVAVVEATVVTVGQFLDFEFLAASTSRSASVSAKYRGLEAINFLQLPPLLRPASTSAI